MEERFPWIVIDKYFNDNPHALVAHHLDSYNDFFNSGLKRIFKEKNPIRIMKNQNEDTGEYNLKCDMYLGGKDGDKIYYGKPIIYDEDREHFMYPNEARLRNMTYGITIHYDVEVEFFMKNPDSDEIVTQTMLLDKLFLGRFPIMLHSDLCILNGLDRNVRFAMGECRNDNGGYFLIDGKEKSIISQEKFADNMVYVRNKGNELYSHSAEIRSVSEDASKPVRTLSVKFVTPSVTFTNNQIVVIVPNVRKPIPLFILLRALGVESDRDIIDYCLLDREKYASYVDLFIPSVHDAARIFTQEVAISYIATFTKGKTDAHALEILTNYLLPHIGEMNFQEKAYFIGYMVFQLIQVYTNDVKPTDRDNFKFKRIELPGSLLYDLFKEYYSIQQHSIFQRFDKEFYFKPSYAKDFTSLITLNYKEFFSERLVETGFRKAFKGNWGAETHTKRIGVVQDLNRLSFNSALSQMRKLNLPLDASAKIVGPRLAHTTQWGIIDTIDTPDGANVGLHKHLTMMAKITRGYSAFPMMKWLRKNAEMLLLSECTPLILAKLCKVMVNGRWIGAIAFPRETLQRLKNLRRIAVIPTFTSIHWSIDTNTLFVYTDAGRICRPIFYTNLTATELKPSYSNDAILEKIYKNEFTWEQLITGFAKKRDETFEIRAGRIYDTISELYSETDLKAFSASQAILDYIDTSESEGALIAMDFETAKQQKKPYTHIEIHPSIMLGVMGNQVIFPENNQLPRDLFACGQAKQAVSMYHSNYQVRMDKTGLILNHGQTPLIKSRYLKHINKEEHPCGENTIVAIMSWNGYNVEDSILFNEGSVKRGLLRMTYHSVYESREESSTVGKNTTDSHFANIENKNVVGLKPGCFYDSLDEYGLIKENTVVNEKMVLIGKVVANPDEPDTFIDASSFPKKGQLGYVDKSFMTEGEEGFRIAKVRIRHERLPAIGDKFGSRCGQKGTVGVIVPEADMPFMANGLKPDIIINPHAIPSRMTIGQLVESLMGKACLLKGAFGDCTAFVNKSDMPKVFGEMLTENGFHSSGNDILYNGQTGEQIQSDIYIGPTYYMRLKHMVKDKINYRALGPRTALTRQPVQGRANDGGLRIGEMERDGLISHGISGFLQESMLVRGDDYYMAICNKTGTVAIYNEEKNLFLSPFADGPIRFNGTLGDNLSIQTMSKYGRSFSIVRVPYAFKLLMQELLTMNVQMRIITEDNIDQLTNMSFSNNIQTLTGKNIEMKELLLQMPKTTRNATTDKMRKENIAALGFIKLPSPPFKKWRLNPTLTLGVENLTPVPTAGDDTVYSLEDAQEEKWRELIAAVDAAKSKLDDIPKDQYTAINPKLNMYSTLRKLVEKTYNMEHATQAALKMYEMIYQMKLLVDTNTNRCLPAANVFCNAELPGAFIIAINHFLKTKCGATKFDWVASSYFPEAAMKAGNETILEDRYKIYEKNRTHWLMGPAPNGLPPNEEPISGDIRDPAVVNAIGNAVHQRFAANDGANLYTSDVGIELTDEESNRQEELTSFLNYGQIVSGLLSLAVGGDFVTKQFTFVTPFSRSLIALIATLFTEAYITKPTTSRPSNSEIYVVGKGFKGISKEMADALLNRAEAFTTLGKLPWMWGSIIAPVKLAMIDVELLAIAKEIHGEQQINFLNEIDNYHKKVFLAGYEREIKPQIKKMEDQAQMEWLKNNPLEIIPSEQNLNNAIQATEYTSMFNPATAATAATDATAATAAFNESIVDISPDSILMPEENKPKPKPSVKKAGEEGEIEETSAEEGEETSTEEGENKQGSKKIVNFAV